MSRRSSATQAGLANDALAGRSVQPVCTRARRQRVVLQSRRETVRQAAGGLGDVLLRCLLCWSVACLPGIGCRDVRTGRQPVAALEIDLDSRRPAQRLSEYGLFRDLQRQIPAAGVMAYELNSTSFVDHADSSFYLYLPPGAQAQYRRDAPLEFPVGTVLIQNLRFPRDLSEPGQGARLVETRLLIRKNFGWTGVPYLWNSDQTDAERAVIGGKTTITVRNGEGEPQTFSYLTPNMNDCQRCHVSHEQMLPIGVTAGNLNRLIKTGDGHVHQLVRWQEQALLSGLPSDLVSVPALPDWRDTVSADTAQRARSWLHVNCAHCHRPGGPAIVSGLDLAYSQNEPVRFGVYKPPVAAGRGSDGHRFSIVPGEPDKSFLLHRVRATDLGVMMPPLGRSTTDVEGARLLREWIEQMPRHAELAKAALNPMAAYRNAVAGGDAGRGEMLFAGAQQCISCHRVGQRGADVGPNLSDVGKRASSEELLRSLVDPSAKIAEGYQTEVVTTASGRIFVGVVKAEDEYEVVIADGSSLHRIDKSEIEERTSSDVSTMPALAGVLSVDDARDLVAYLRTLQSPPSE